MELKTFFAQDSQGNAVASPTVHVYLPGTTTAATGLKDAAGAPITSPFTGEATGRVRFQAPNGVYDVRVVVTGHDYTQRMQFLDFGQVANAPKTSNFIAPYGNILRMGDRLFVGGAVEQDGLYPNVTWDWLTAYERGTGGRSNGTMVSAQAAILNNDYFGAGVSLLLGVQTAHFISAGTGASSGTNVVVNNHATLQTQAWGGYDEAHRDNDVVGSTIGREINVRNGGAYHAITPHAQHPKMTVAVQVASGCEYPGEIQAPISAFCNFRDNGSKAAKGIIFGVDSLDTVDSPNPSAMAMAPTHSLTWYSSETNESWKVFSTANSGSGYLWHSVGKVTFGETDITVSKNSTSAAKSLFLATANVNRWSVGSTATAESGSNVGSDFAIARFSDAGAYLGLPFQIRRTNGRIILAELAASASYANDAAAAAAGVQVGELYRNGSAVQIRVS